MSTTRKHDNFAVPDDWRMVRLRDVLILDQPGAWGDDPTPDDPGVRVLRAADLTRDGKLSVESAAWRRLTARDRERRLMKNGDLILERSGGGPGTPVGRVALIKDLGTIYCNNFCQQLRVDDQQCNPRYAARALWHRYVQGVTSRLEHQTTGIRNLDYTGYLNHPIILPSLPEQRAIADVLDSIDEAIERTEAVIAATETLRDSLLHELLTRGVPGWHTEWKDVTGIGTIPADWEVVRLGEVATVNPKRPPLDVPPETAVTFLPMSSVGEDLGGIKEREIRPFRDVAKGYTYFEENDILFAKITPCLQNGKHALAAEIDGPFGFGTTEFHVVRGGHQDRASFLVPSVNAA